MNNIENDSSPEIFFGTAFLYIFLKNPKVLNLFTGPCFIIFLKIKKFSIERNSIMTNLEVLYLPQQKMKELKSTKMHRDCLRDTLNNSLKLIRGSPGKSEKVRSTLQSWKDEITELDEAIVIRNTELNDACNQASEMINRHFSYPKSALLEKRYIAGEKWADIAAELSYAEKYCLQLNRDCLKVLENSGK